LIDLIRSKLMARFAAKREGVEHVQWEISGRKEMQDGVQILYVPRKICDKLHILKGLMRST
jgi:hypothetical protein